MGKDGGDFLRRHDFKLSVGAVGGLLVGAPAAELGDMAEAAALHVVVRDLDHQFGTHRLPRQVFALTPAALAAGHAAGSFTALGSMLGPGSPGMSSQCVLAIRLEKLGELAAFLHAEAGADADVLQGAGFVEEAEQERADESAIAFLVPAKAGHHAVTVTLVLDLEHHALVGLVGSGYRLGDDAVEAGAFKTLEPVGGNVAVDGGRSEMNGRRRGADQRFQLVPPGPEGIAAEVAVAEAQQVEEDQ